MIRTLMTAGILSLGLQALGLETRAYSQAITAPGGSTMPSAAVMANPYMNPYLNPYLNPAATQRPVSAGNAALYLYQANAANGGIGSGRLSGTKGATARAKPAEMPVEVASPGGGARKYFNPGPVNVNGAGRYINQRRSFFQNNRR